MNANEVTAEYLASLLADSQDPDVRRAVAMLRQQQTEIDNLTSVKYVNGVTISNLYAEIEALKVKAHEWYLIAIGKAQEK